MFETMEMNLDDSFDEDDESFDEDDSEDDEAFGERTVRFRRSVPRIGASMQASRGVSTATLRTPAGNAQLQLPQSVVTLEVFNRAVAGLREAHNKLAGEVSANREAIKKSGTEATALAKATKRSFVRERKRASQNNMMNMLMAMMANRSTNRRIDEIQGATTADSDSMMMMLPLMMMGDGGSGSGGDNGMMMMVMMMAMMDK
ncbi:MAG: hypothetical protein IAG13_34165 [Deltaproteobacteria bacterium]|nr:hypothetical protein [Nannocystaceae bacterium]